MSNNTPEIVNRKAFTVIGLEYSGPMDNLEGISGLWGSYIKRAGEITPKASETTGYGVFYSTPEQADLGEISYMACAPVTPDTEIPEGMERLEVPGGKFARYTHKGRLTDLPLSFQTLFQWLSASPWKTENSPGYELYDERFNPSSPVCEIDIFIPVKKQ